MRYLSLFLHGVYGLHGLPRVPVSDPDPKFVSGFSRMLCRRLWMRLDMSSSRHPDTDGCQQQVSAAFALFLLLRWSEMDKPIAISGIRVQRYTCAWNLAHSLHANLGFSLEEPCSKTVTWDSYSCTYGVTAAQGWDASSLKTVDSPALRSRRQSDCR
jgi:hypothetical protein